MWVRVVVVDEDSVTAGNRNASRLNLAALPSAPQLEDPMAGAAPNELWQSDFTQSSPPRPTGATNSETPADGRGFGRLGDTYVPT